MRIISNIPVKTSFSSGQYKLNPLNNHPSDSFTSSTNQGTNENEKKEPKAKSNLQILKSFFRTKRLEHLGVSGYIAQNIAQYNDERYKKSLELLKSGVYEECIHDVSLLEGKRYEQALDLVGQNILTEKLHDLANLEEDDYKKVIEFKNNGLTIENINLFIKLSSSEREKAFQLMQKGLTPKTAAYLAKLNQNEQDCMQQLMSQNFCAEIAFRLAKMSPEQREKCINLHNKGISEDEIIGISELDEDNSLRLDELIAMNIGDENIKEFAMFTEDKYSKAIQLFKEGVLPEYISDIIDIENGELERPEYFEYRENGFSRSLAFSLSLLDNHELQEFKKLAKLNPKMRELYSEEYDVNLIKKQDSRISEVIFSKEIRCDNGTQITFVKTFDEDGNSTVSRTEEYKNHSTSSILKGQSDVFRLKYDKFGEIREMSQIIQDSKNHSVTGVIHTKASEKLKGAFESTYYDINDFKTDNGSIEGSVDFDIEDSVKNKGTTLSKVIEMPDGTIIYEENFKTENVLTNRNYQEKKDDNGNVIYSSYSYKILDKNDVLMDIKREYIRNADGSVVNKINGVEYTLKYDDETKEVTISDGNTEKVIDFKSKISKYSTDVIWNLIKNLHADTLYTLSNNIEQWAFCDDEDAVADGYAGILNSGSNLNVIMHETGHFKSYENEKIFSNKEFLDTYTEEMNKFLNTVPFNEQEFVQYFSPRADLNGSTGISEFFAESNIILSNYGTAHNKLNTRSQFLVRNFPRTIAKAAELLEKTSKESILT